MSAERYHRTVVYLLLALLALPVLGTLIYSMSERWDATVLPHGLTLHWYASLWQDQRFLMAFWHSLAICFGTLFLSTVVIVPAVFAIQYEFPRLDRWMNILILLPFAVPPVVSSVGLLSLYSSGPLPMIGTPWILLGCYFTIALPFMYRMLSDSLRAIDVRELMDASHLLGASAPRAFLAVILPSMRKGLLASLFISFSFLLGEFVFANMLVGTRYETLQVYLYNMRNSSGHFTSALVMSYFMVTFGLTWLAMRLGSRRES